MPFAPRDIIWPALGIVTISFHLWLIFAGLVPNLVSRPIHMALALPWIFLWRPAGQKPDLLSWAFCLMGVVGCAWVAMGHNELSDQYGSIDGPWQTFLAIGLLAAAIDMARRAVGWPLPSIAILMLLYGMFGNYIPGEFGHGGMPLTSFLGTLTITEGGIWGSLTGVSVTIVAIFVIFGAVLNAGQAGAGFMNIAAAVAGRLTGGAAKVSVLSSALFGSISGSASANVASTGAITLPAMRKLGYPRSLAGAVEAVASSGGQIMPPLMGAGAFVMVELTGVPYDQIMLAALPAAILYFFAVWMAINAYAKRYDLPGVPESERPSNRLVVITTGFFAVPFAALLYGMFGLDFTPQYAACMAVVLAALLLLTDETFAFDSRAVLARVRHAAMTSGQQVSMIASIIICASIIIGVLGMTGLGVKITSVILSGSGGLLWPAILLTALTCLLLGMEVPTTAAYVICVSVAGPALTELGLGLLQTHLFVFWFALLSTITPPVCGAVFIAAGMIEENWLKVAMKSMALGLGLYLIPLGMISTPDLIDLGNNPMGAVIAMLKIGTATTLVAYGVIAPGNWRKRLLLVLFGAITLFWPLD
ncbi:MAG: TRAP transporter fused permease subunit [Burkholderiaceae bacterium]|nr:TRAP transporter fused permease subunit [Burkholderiaceae bacterium]MCD8516628.1 TRAP transporter fused permease subunit [Burkholderiaceae bacterium]MCD8564798.1 TRAP transporter fused permease subunit [Burkholderiaceae bacterium]